MTVETITAQYGRNAPHNVTERMKWARGVVEEAMQVAAYMPDGYSEGVLYDVYGDPFMVKCILTDTDAFFWFDNNADRLFDRYTMAGKIERRAAELEMPPRNFRAVS